MNRFDPASRPALGHRKSGLAIPVAVALLAALAGSAYGAPQGWTLKTHEPGGVLPRPCILGTQRGTNATTITWTGFGGPYTVEQAQQLGVTNAWSLVSVVSNGTSLKVPGTSPMGFIRVSGPPAKYAGADTCGLCHPDQYAAWTNTLHAGAFDALKKYKSDTNAYCLQCHTAGFGLATGFTNATATPQLAGVQCENCHGPGGDHALHPSNDGKRPVLTISPLVCGGCHTGEHNPQYDEWATSAHSSVLPDVANSFMSIVATNLPGSLATCGACHSGATRYAMVDAVENGVDPVFPSQASAAATGITCSVCHDPHVNTSNGAHLRYPMASTNSYSYSTAQSFAAQYNPNINTCGQCHNMRGATWTGTSRPPHHSPQYNILIADGGVSSSTNAPPSSPHRDIDTQCAHCHVSSLSVSSPTAQNPNFRGHTFKAEVTACAPCHDAEEATVFIGGTQTYTKTRIAAVKGLLDSWSMAKAPAAMRTKYGAAAWEFSNIGALSTLPAGVTSGPSATEQANVPANIKKARHNLYLVLHDASFGVHNGRYTRWLLDTAEGQVRTELGQ